MKSSNRMISFFIKFFLLAVLYIASGYLGLILAVPPGYSTLIWPPSGIALGFLMIYGWRLWPSVLLGSFILNCYISNAYTPEIGLVSVKIYSAFFIAIGSSLQALTGFILVKKYIIPIQSNLITQITKFFFLVAPIICLIAATISHIALYYFNLITPDKILESWSMWWAGDLLGIFVFFPLMLISPINQNTILVYNKPIKPIPLIAIMLLLMIVGMSFYTWRILTEINYKNGKVKFESLVSENKLIILNRFDSYENALLGAEALLDKTTNLKRKDWHDYINTIKIKTNFPEIQGMGFITDVKREEADTFIKKQKEDEMPGFNMHPILKDKPLYIVTYIEPYTDNRQAVGLNLASEPKPIVSAEYAKHTGQTTLTEQITLVQDENKSSGFLILHPIYWDNQTTDNTKKYHTQFRGWVYMPVISKNFIKNLTDHQNNKINFKIYEGSKEDNNNLIYSSIEGYSNHQAQYEKQELINLMGQKWLIVWSSNSMFEKEQRSSYPLIALSLGLFFSILFSIYLLLNHIKNAEEHRWIEEKHGFALPFAIFFFLLIGTSILFLTLEKQEDKYLQLLIEDQAKRIETILQFHLTEKLLSLKRMAARWEISNGTPESVWIQDSLSYMNQFSGIIRIEYIDSNFITKWSIPDTNLTLNNPKNSLYQYFLPFMKKAAMNDLPLVTPVFSLSDDSLNFAIYIPIKLHSIFNGFIYSILSVNSIFTSLTNDDINKNFFITLRFDKQNHIQNYTDPLSTRSVWTSQKYINLLDKKWELNVSPTKDFIQSNKSFLPLIVLFCGVLISLLSAFLVRFILVSLLKSHHLIESNKKITESDERYDLVVKGMSAGLWDWKILTGEMYWSYKLKEMFGIKDLSFVPDFEYFVKHLHPDDKDTILKKLYDHLEKHTPYDVEYRIRLPSTNYRWFQASGQAQWNKEGKAVRMAGSVIDINIRVNIKNALQESISLKKAILAGAKHMIITTDTKGIVTLFNHAAEVALGYKQDEVIGILTPVIWHDPLEVINKAKVLSEELNISIHPGFDVLVKKAQIWGSDETEWTFIRKDGSRFLVQMTVSLLKTNDNISGYICIIEDITDRKRAENALKRNEETFRSAIESASIGMALVSTDGHWLMVNKALCEMLGYSEQEFLNLDFQSITYPDDLPGDEEFVRKMLAKEIKTYQIEKRYIHKNGKIIWAQLSVAMMLDENSNPSYFISQIQDITEVKETERIKSELSSIINHELRTPLTSIRGSLGLIEGAMSENLPPKVSHLIKIAYKNSDRLILLINDMLDIDKIASGKMQFKLEEQSLAKLIDQAIESNQPYADKYGVLLVKGHVDNSIVVKVDPERLLQVLTNLLSNAAKFSDVSNEVYLYTEVVNGKIRITVRDYGIGIQEEFYDRIFDKFSQADSSTTRSQQGTGLGLYISKELIEKMNGSIHFESQIGKGSSFYIDLPIALNSEQPVEKKKNIIVEHKVFTNELPLILHVEENADLSNMLATALNGHAKLIQADTLKKAKKLVAQHPFNLIIMDIIMPDGFGFDLIKFLPRESLATTKIIILSAHEPSDLIRDHVDAVIIKSRIHEAEIVNIILKLLNKNPKKDKQ